MVDIEKIVGEKAYARLKAAGSSSADDIKKMSAQQIMSMAGIGPVRAGRLMRALGKKITQKEVKKEYRELKNKTRFKKLKQAASSLTKDPREKIDRLERKRKELLAWQNLLINTRNIGRPQSERLKPKTYAPVSTTLDPFSVQLGESTQDDIYGEIFVTPEEGRARINYQVKNLTDGDDLLTENDFVDNQNSVEMVTKIGNIIEDMYTRFRKRTTVGLFFVVLDQQFTDIGFYDGLRERFRSLINQEKIILKATQAEYYDWEALFKYQGNKRFSRMIEALDRFHKYILYEKYKKRGGSDAFGDWREDEDNYEDKLFWNYMQQATGTSQVSNQSIYLDKGTVQFGILKGIRSASNFESDFKQVPNPRNDYRDTGWEGYEGLRREIPVDVEGTKVPAEVLAMANSVLVDYKTYALPNGEKVLFQSRELPEVGIYYDGR